MRNFSKDEVEGLVSRTNSISEKHDLEEKRIRKMSRAIINIFYTLTIFRLPAKYKQETDMVYSELEETRLFHSKSVTKLRNQS